jgi:hypothetical protein
MDNNTNKSQQDQQIEKYVRGFKELPVDMDKDHKSEENNKQPPHLPKKTDTPPVISKQPVPVVPKTDETKNKQTVSVGQIDTDEPEKDTGSKFPLSRKDIALAAINIFAIIFLTLLITKLPAKAKELQQVRSDSVWDYSNIEFELSRIEKDYQRAQELEKVFLDESGVVDYFKEVEDLRGESTSISRLTITSQKAIQDKTGNYVIPLIIDLSGSWEQIEKDMQSIQNLPYIFRPVKIDIEEEADSVVRLKYGGVLYTNEKSQKD